MVEIKDPVYANHVLVYVPEEGFKIGHEEGYKEGQIDGYEAGREDAEST